MTARPSPTVARLARTMGVDASRLVGTGAGGRVTVADVRAAAHPPSLTAGRLEARASTVAPSVEAQWRRNPLVEEARAARPTEYEAAAAIEPPPTLFANGDLPLFTASGIEPAVLLELPWTARHAAAATTDRGRVAAMLEECAPHTEASLSNADAYRGHDGARDYQQRVQDWLRGNTPAQRAATDPLRDHTPMTSDEIARFWTDLGLTPGA